MIENLSQIKLKLPMIANRTGGVIFVDNNKTYRVNNVSRNTLLSLKHLSKGIDNNILDRYKKENSEFDTLLKWFYNNDWIISQQNNSYINTLNEKNYEYLRGACETPDLILENIKNSHIAIIGCGGVGSVVAQNLVGMGFENLSLIDYDKIEYSNLNRQVLYFHSEIKQSKAQVLAKKLKLINPRILIDVFINKIQSTNDLDFIYEDKKPDFVVCAIDSPPVLSKLYVSKFCSARKIPCIFGSVGISSGHYGPLLDSNKHIDAFESYLKNYNEKYFVEDINIVVGSLFPTNSIIASFMALDIFKWFSDAAALSHNKILKVSFNTGITEEVHHF